MIIIMMDGVRKKWNQEKRHDAFPSFHFVFALLPEISSLASDSNHVYQRICAVDSVYFVNITDIIVLKYSH